jgi:AcrR family transcriptional regulator
LAVDSLRERKKAHTRRRLIEASQRLFLSQGYAETTLEAIAAEVEVNIKTLLRYFPTKQDLALALEYQVLERCRAGLADAARGASAVEFYCEFVRAIAAQWVADSRRAQRLDYFFLLYREPAILAQSLVLLQAYEDVLAEAVAAELGVTGFDLYSRVVAAMAVNSMDAVVRRWAAKPRGMDLLADIDALRDFFLHEFPSRDDAPQLTRSG